MPEMVSVKVVINVKVMSFEYISSEWISSYATNVVSQSAVYVFFRITPFYRQQIGISHRASVIHLSSSVVDFLKISLIPIDKPPRQFL